jgi:hypothetical protein
MLDIQIQINTNNIFVEKYAWVDELLAEKYNLYALTEENVDDFINANLLNERYSEIDNKLEKTSNSSSSPKSKNSSASSGQFISNPFCNIDVEEIFNSLVHLQVINDSETISEISSRSYTPDTTKCTDILSEDDEEDSIFLEIIDGYDSDDYYQRFGFNPEEKMFCYH